MSTIDGIDYGPLAALVGTWEGDKGTDIAPEPDGTEENPYYETITFYPAGDVENAETQTLSTPSESRRRVRDGGDRGPIHFAGH